MIWICLFLWAIAGMVHFVELHREQPDYDFDRLSWRVVVFFPTYVLLGFAYVMLLVLSFFASNR